MSLPKKRLRAPADSLKIRLNRLVSSLIASRFWPVRLCRHRHVTLPFNDRQHCIDCGCSRLYLFRSDFEHADTGIYRGPWLRPRLPLRQNAARLVSGSLIDNAIAAGRRLAIEKGGMR